MEDGGKNIFKKFFSRMKIRSKLITIISMIIITSLTGMIILATIFFKNDSEIRIKENNQSVADILALKVQTDFIAIVEKMNLMGTAMLHVEQKNLFTDLFFANDPNLISVGIAYRNPDGKTIRIVNSIYNKSFFGQNQLKQGEIDAFFSANGESLMKSFGNDVIVINISSNMKSPAVLIGMPFQRAGNTVNSILVGCMKLDKLMSAFKSSGITEKFMVNEHGDVITHTDSRLVMSQVNYINLPIVQMMKKSSLDNGQTRYRNEKGVYYIGSFKKTGFSGIGVIASVEEDKAFEEVFNIQRRNIFIMVIVLNLAILIVYFFSKTITTPIIELLGATKEIEKGNFRINIVPTTEDEIGDLTSSFVHMGRGLEERERMKDAFGKFVNKEIAEQVLRGEIKLGGERKNATVFFSDIRSFTAISEKLEPEEVVEFLNQYMTRMVNCVNQTFGVVDKYIGDAIMAVWGAPVSRGNDTENAINGALMMRKALMEFNVGRGGDKKPVIKIGCGINTGPVLAGQIGTEDRMEYTVIGDTVNLASRIESLNKPFGTDILVSEETYESVKDIFRAEPMQKIKVKGKAEPQQIYAILGRLEDSDSPRSLEDLRRMLKIEITGKPAGPVEDEVKYEILE
ncbi:MAG: HAMP domain-containing protein [Spirochaetes bacterium]|jgi:adenylate cyclase|nr:HAMP domain-containing protein [Spirochaetota bacterium]